ncbi:MAG: universal stress protein [Deltaproteobacteria bacterium]|nr:universal stress protein [Deltaproteobacteria bacterium]
MFEKILYPTDFSNEAHKALDFVISLKDAGAKEVVILHVIEKANFDAIARYATKDIGEIEKNLKARAMAEIQPIEERLKKKGFKVKVVIAKAVPYMGILDVEKKEKVSAIVIGSHGMSNIAEIFLGSVSEKIVRRAKTPVLVVR